jgi:hypothetical protein
MAGIKMLAALAVLLVASEAPAATIEIDGDGVRITGELVVADIDTFRRMVSGCRPKDTVITFDSPGGALSAGLKMGELADLCRRAYRAMVRQQQTTLKSSSD